MGTNETLNLILAAVAGAGLGAFFFGGLWWTVRQSIASRQPALLFFASLLLRTGVTLTGFYLFAGGADAHWQRLLLCLVGFVAARLAVMRLTRTAYGKGEPSAPEIEHAP